MKQNIDFIKEYYPNIDENMIFIDEDEKIYFFKAGPENKIYKCYWDQRKKNIKFLR